MGRVVVWISETQVGLAALRQAIAEARRGGATLYAVDLTRWRPGPVGEMSLIQRHSVPADSNWHALATFNRAANGVPTVLDVEPATVIGERGRTLTQLADRHDDLLVACEDQRRRTVLGRSVARYCRHGTRSC